MKVNPVNVKINDLIDEHNEVSPYGTCPGCDLCLEIERISKEQGMWISGEQRIANEKVAIGKKISASLTKSEMEKYIKSGLTNREISKKVGLTEKVISIKIRSWFPNIDRRKRRVGLGISLERYQELRKQGVSRTEIAKQLGVSTVELDNHLSSLRREKRKEGNASRIKGNAMC